MKTEQGYWVVDLAVIALLGSVAVAGAPMGPPMALLEEGQWTVDVEYGYEEIDMEASGTIVQTSAGSPPLSAELLKIEDLKSNMIFGTLAYGVCDNWDLFLRLGAADAKDEVVVHTGWGGSPGERSSYDGGYGFAWGFGTRATFCRWGPWSFGGLMQVTWFNPGKSDWRSASPDVPDVVSVGCVDMDYWQTQVGLAATYQIDTWHFWAGPFLQFVEGNLDRHGDIFVSGTDSGDFQGSSNIQERSQIGVHVGANWDFSEKLNCWVEGQLAGDSWLIGLGAVIRPERVFGGR